MSTHTHTFHVHGMHCRSCVLVTESELTELGHIDSAKANLETRTVVVTGDFGDREAESIAEDLTQVLEKHGYRLAVEREVHDARWRDFSLALPIAIGFAVVFVLLQKLGIVNLIGGGEITYGTAFGIGAIASVSSCMAVVGGLVLSMSANYAKEGKAVKPQALFHIGRLVAFFVLGGVVGAIGSAFTLGSTGIFVLSLLVAIVMLILGINLLDVFPWVKRLQPTLPTSVSGKLLGLKRLNHTLTPLVVGAVTFFLPCGFTQSMQLYTLTTGTFMKGSLIMFAFALGTLPVLALLSFGSVGLKSRKASSLFFKTAGLVVIFFALVNITTSMAAAGIIPPLLNF